MCVTAQPKRGRHFQLVPTDAEPLSRRFRDRSNGGGCGGAVARTRAVGSSCSRSWPRAIPVTTDQMRDAAGRTAEQIRQALAAMPDTEYDEQGRVIGGELTQRPTPKSTAACLHLVRSGHADLPGRPWGHRPRRIPLPDHRHPRPAHRRTGVRHRRPPGDVTPAARRGTRSTRPGQARCRRANVLCAVRGRADRAARACAPSMSRWWVVAPSA